MSLVFSDAVVSHLGYGTAVWPQSNPLTADPLVRRKLDEILAFAGALEPDWNQLNLVQAGDWARERFAANFPYLTHEALDALAWSCTFGWK